MEFTGERCMPKLGLGNVEEHIAIYNASLPHISGKFVLDIASGSGWGTHLLASKGATYVIGVDISEEAIDYANTEYPGDNHAFVKGNILNIPFPNNIFQIVNTIETFEHVKHDEIDKLISECCRVLRPGGLWLFSSPDGSIFPYHPCGPFEYRGWHFWHYTINELYELLRPKFQKVEVRKLEIGGSNFVICVK